MRTKFARAAVRSLRPVVMLLAALGTYVALSPTATAAAPMGVAFVYLGNPGDAGWTYAHEQGVKAIEAKFGDKIKVTRVENVPAHGLSNVPSPGHASFALSAFDVIVPPGPAKAAVSSVAAFAGSALMIRIAIRARSEFESFSHFAMSPL